MRRGMHVLAGIMLVFLAGCGSAGTPSGKITLNGQPVAGAEIVIQPDANPDAPVVGLSGPDGEYRLDFAGKSGVPTGKCRVAITHYTLRNGKPLPGGEEGAALKNDELKVLRTVYSFDKEIV